jgi:glycosyltransferase involved in cell wall biosynthesis
MLLLHNYKKELVAQCAVGFNLPEERFVHCYYNAVDPTLFPDPGQSSPLRDKHRLSRQAFIMVHVSTFRKHHDFDTLLRAASTLDFPYEILFVGTGGRVSEVKEKARALGVTARFLGSRTLAEIAELQMASDVCVDPLLPFYVAEDNLRPAKLWEYVASGRPVVETIDPGLPVADWAREWLALVPPADTAALADALRDIRSRPDIWAQKGMRAREWVLANHTWKHVAEEVVSAVQLAMEKRRGN